MPFNFAKPDDDATLRSLLKQTAWIVEAAPATAEDPLQASLGISCGLKETLALVVAAEKDLTGSDASAILLLDENQATLVLAGHNLEGYGADLPRMDATHETWRRALAGKRAALQGMDGLPPVVRDAVQYRLGMQRLMLAPLRAGSQPIGLIASFGRQTGAWAAGAEDALSSLAALAGSALAASLRREVELNQAREVETSALVERCVALLAGRAIDSREAMRFIQRRSMNSRQSRRRVAASFLLAEALKGASKALAA